MEIHNKALLTIKEACEYSSIGENKMRSLIEQPLCPFVVYNGNRRLIKRKIFEKWLEEQVFL